MLTSWASSTIDAVERWARYTSECRRQSLEKPWPSQMTALPKALPNAFEDRPQRLTLLRLKSRLAPEPRNVAIGLPRIQLPSVDDLFPFAFKKLR